MPVALRTSWKRLPKLTPGHGVLAGLLGLGLIIYRSLLTWDPSAGLRDLSGGVEGSGAVGNVSLAVSGLRHSGLPSFCSPVPCCWPRGPTT
jgi:hypothetical protein